jgi:hypothetical protein
MFLCSGGPRAFLAPVLTAAEQPHAPVWSILDRQVARRAGLIPLTAHKRWADAWVIGVLNAWLETGVHV